MASKMNGEMARKILGVSFKTTLEELKKVYRKLAMKFHPDREGGNEEKFKEVKEAYEYLEKNGSARSDDDVKKYRAEADAYEHFKNTYKNKYERDYYSGTNYTNDNEYESEYSFEERDVKVHISVETAFKGRNITHTVTHFGKKHVFILTIPAGIKDGQKINFEGNSFIEDEYLGLKIECKINFYASVNSPGIDVNWTGSYDGSRVGDITQEILVSPFKMFLGGWERITTLDGKEIDIRIPAGQKANKKLKVQGKGYWKNTDRDLNRGDLYLTTVPNITKLSELSQDSKNDIRQLYEMVYGAHNDTSV